jgi:DNA-binding SARP family transcriptional activator
MTITELRLLGRPELRVGGSSVSLATRKTLALLAVLAIEPGRHRRDSLAARLWPDADQDRARASLRTTLAYLREGLGPAGNALAASRDSVELQADANNLTVDVAVVEAAAGAADPGAAQLEAAAMLWRGEPLEDFELDDAPDFQSWLANQRSRLRETVERVFDRLSRLQLERGNPEAALETATRWARLEPLSEPARRQMMTAREAAGDRARAVESFEGFRALLEGELGVRPSPETEHLAARIRSGQAGGQPARTGERALAPVPGEATRSWRGPPPGRAVQWAALETAWTSGSTAFIEGEAGAGKSRLLEDFLASRVHHGLVRLEGRPSDVGAPYAPVARALRAARIGPPPSARVQRELSRLLPELEAEPLPPLASEEGRLRLFEAVATVLVRPNAALAIDDAHFLDAASADLAAFLLERDPAPAWAILAARPGPVPGTLGAVISRREARGELVRVPVGHLDLDALSDLVREARPTLDPAEVQVLADRLARLTAGHALLAAELARSESPLTSARQVVTLRAEGFIRGRLAELPEAALRAARLSAITGGGLDLTAAAATLDLGPREAAAIQEALENSGVARGSRFTHDLMAEVTASRIPASALPGLHALALGALEARGGGPGTLAPHAAGAGDMDRAARLARQAARDARAVWALDEAAVHYRLLLRALERPGLPVTDDELAAREELVGVLYQARRSGEAREEADQLLGRARLAGAAAVACRALGTIVWLLGDVGELEAAAAAAREAEVLAEASGDPRARAEALVVAADHAFFLGDAAADSARANEALAVARDLGDPGLTGALLWRTAKSLGMSGDWPGSLTRAKEAAALFASSGSDPLTHCFCLAWVGWAAAAAGRPREANQYASVAIEAASSVNENARVEALQVLGLARLEADDVPGALEALALAQRSYGTAGQGLRHERGVAVTAWAAWAAGDVTTAQSRAKELEGPGGRIFALSSRVLRVLVALASGDDETALLMARSVAADVGGRPPVLAFGWWAVAGLLARSGDTDAAKRLTAWLERFGAMNPRTHLAALRAQAAVEAVAGHLDSAEKRLREAEGLAADGGLVLEFAGIRAQAARLRGAASEGGAPLPRI